MRTKSSNARALGKMTALGLSLLLATTEGQAQAAKVAAASVEITANAATKELSVGFRLVDAAGVTSVSATADGVDKPLPTTWEAWTDAKAQRCAWMIVVDTSNPARAKTIEACKEEVRGFLSGVPKTDAVAVYGMARDLAEVAAFDINRDDVMAGISKLKADGDASQSTLIYQNLREGLGKLSARKEPRKALLVLTDGKDETPGGPAALEIEKKKFIDAAKAAGVAVHTLGYAETAKDQPYFTHLKEISTETDGLFFPATLDTKKPDAGVISLIRNVMQGAGVAHVKLETLEMPAGLTIKAKTASGAEATLKVAADEVAKAIAKPEEKKPEPDMTAGKTPEELAKEKAEAEKIEADRIAKEKEEADRIAKEEKEKEDKRLADEKAKAEAEAKKKLWIIIGASALLVIGVVAFLMMRAASKRAAEEEARLAEEARRAEEARLAEEQRLAATVVKKPEEKPLAWLEMCDAQQTRHPVRISSLKIGRGSHNDFVLRNDSVSGNHCVLNRTREGMWSVTDLNSGNGVILNGERIQQGELRHGDTIELGDIKMRFLIKG